MRGDFDEDEEEDDMDVISPSEARHEEHMAEPNATRLADIQRAFGVDVHTALRVQDVLAGHKVDMSKMPRCRKHNMLKLAVAHYYCPLCYEAGEATVGPASAHGISEESPALVEDIVQALRALAYAAMTSGGTAGPDVALKDAIRMATDAIKAYDTRNSR